MSKCTISFNDNENGIFHAGMTLSGTVELYLPEAKKCRGLRLLIEGVAKCKWTDQVSSRNSSRNKTIRGREQYLNNISYLFGGKNGESETIEAGFHIYSFSCFLPPELPYSVEAAHGSIRYKVDANLDIPWGSDVNTVKDFTICRNDDLNLYPDLKIPSEAEDMAKFCCLFFASEPLFLEASIPYSGYTPGDTINVDIKVINENDEIVSRCQIELIRNIKYTSEENNTKYESEVMVKVEVQALEKTVKFNKELIIPSVLTNTNELFCKILQITYEIKVTCKTESCNKSPEVYFPITLGSVPLSFGQDFEPNIAMSLLANSSITPPSFEQVMNQNISDLEARKNIGWTKY